MAQFSNVSSKKKKPTLQECRNGCGTVITFDYEDYKTFGKWRPIEYETKEPHDCPESTYNKSKRGEVPEEDEEEEPQRNVKGEIMQNPTLKQAEQEVKQQKEAQQKATGNISIALENLDRAVLALDGELGEVKSIAANTKIQADNINKEVEDIKKLVLGVRDSFVDFVKTYGIKPANEIIQKDTNPSVHNIEEQKDTTKLDRVEIIPSDNDDIIEE